MPATVLHYELRTGRSRQGLSQLPTLHESLVATYRYDFNGSDYTGSRVDFSFGSDNFSNSRRAVQLAALQAGRITVYVDPRNPRESVMDTSLPGPQVVFAILFLLFPCGIGTALGLGLVSTVLGKLGLTGGDRYYLPMLGVLHGAPALYPAVFAPDAVGYGGWLIIIAFLALLAISLWSIWRRLRDPAIGQPRWPVRSNKKSPS